MIVTVHQPNLFPWLGFFDKMAQSDLFIFLDNVPFTKRGYQNRVGIKAPHGHQWLTVPVETKGKFAQITKDVQIINTTEWKKDHLKSFQLFYGKAPNFTKIYPVLEDLYNKTEYYSLTHFTEEGINLIKNHFNISTPTLSASELNIHGQSSQLIADLVAKVGGTVYLSGPSGKNYLDHSIFEQKGIEVRYHDYKITPYPQRHKEFIGGLSSLDYMFNVV